VEVDSAQDTTHNSVFSPNQFTERRHWPKDTDLVLSSIIDRFISSQGTLRPVEFDVKDISGILTITVAFNECEAVEPELSSSIASSL